MKVGMLTAPFSGDDLDTVISFAKSAGFDACEVRVGAKHCDLSGKFDAGKLRLHSTKPASRSPVSPRTSTSPRATRPSGRCTRTRSTRR